MKDIIKFLTELQVNNNRDWFDANRARYKELNAQFNTFVEQLIVKIGEFDQSVHGLEVRDCTYRINRDTRFSNNKDPYKTHFGAYICPRGKKSGLAGYYFHIEPTGGGMIGQNMLSSGLYMPENYVLASIREEIIDHGDKFERAIAESASQGFVLCVDNKLKRPPKGFSVDAPYIEYLKLKDLYVEKFVDDAFVTSDDLVCRLAEAYGATYSLMQLLNRAAIYAQENR